MAPSLLLLSELPGAPQQHVSALLSLERASYPPDEAASEARLALRATRLPHLFAVAVTTTSSTTTAPSHHDHHHIVQGGNEGELVGFANGTRCLAAHAGGFPVEGHAMGEDDPAGRVFLVHSVVVRQDARRKGWGSAVLQRLIRALREDGGIDRVVLLCKPHLVGFYVKNGFHFVRDSRVQHGSETWFEFAMDLRAVPVAVVDAFVAPGRQNVYSGNPAAVVVEAVAPAAPTGATPHEPPPKRTHMQVPPHEDGDSAWRKSVARELNLSETAFVTFLDPAPRIGATSTHALGRIVLTVTAGDTHALLFKDVLRLLKRSFHFRTDTLTLHVGDVVSLPGQNLGSFAVLAFAQLMGLSRPATARLWGEHYRDVVASPHAGESHHPNIRAFLRGGEVKFTGGSEPPLTPRDAFGMHCCMTAGKHHQVDAAAAETDETAVLRHLTATHPHHTMFTWPSKPLPPATLALAMRLAHPPTHVVTNSLTAWLASTAIKEVRITGGGATATESDETLVVRAGFAFARVFGLDVSTLLRHLPHLGKRGDVKCVQTDVVVEGMDVDDVVPSLDVVHASLRWFTPTTEVDLCGHATLATAHALLHERLLSGPHAAWPDALSECTQLAFHTRSGVLLATRGENSSLALQFPRIPALPHEVNRVDLAAALGVSVGDIQDVLKAGTDLLVRLADGDAFQRVTPNMDGIAKVFEGRGVCVTAKAGGGERSSPAAAAAAAAADFVSRFFAPRVGIPEDPATGSAHCYLGPYWAPTPVSAVTGFQDYPHRGAVIKCVVGGEGVVVLQGACRTAWKGELLLMSRGE